MIKYFIHLSIIFIVAIAAQRDGSEVKVIKFVQFGQIHWDWCDHVGVENGVTYYVKYDANVPITNYLKHDFKVLTLADYDRERKK